MRNIILGLFLPLLLTTPALADMNIVATLPWIGSLAREIGGDQVTVTTLVKPNQDPHFLEAKPSMILAARKADMIMYNGLDLEIGYLPIVLESARNPKIVPGKPGNFDCSRFVHVIEKPTAVDRSMGDIHPLGNPHYHFSPANVLRVAQGMADVLADLDRTHVDFYRQNFKGFAAKVEAHRKQWESVNLKGKEFVAYHRNFEYLAAEFGFRIVDYIEPKPGIPPSASHIENLIEDMKSDKPIGILVTPGYGLKESESLSARTGAKVVILPQDVGAMPGTDDWFAFMDTVLAALR